MKEIVIFIVGQHAEDAAFFWLQRDAAVREPHYSLADLAKLDNRVEANIGRKGPLFFLQTIALDIPSLVFEDS